jgi:hypothetical protein
VRSLAAPFQTATPRCRLSLSFPATPNAERDMKGMDQKKTEKKKPEKSLKEKRAAKKDKKAGK